jgi:tetratricopeptide (TPR) repeat protein
MRTQAKVDILDIDDRHVLSPSEKKQVFSTRPRPSSGSKKFMTNLFSVKRTLLALGFCLWVTGNSALAAGADLEKANALMKQGKAAEAYSLLEPFEFAQSGDIKFDYLLGIAALDSGKPDKATIAFERVLAVDPNFAGARIDMGRAYYQLGDFTRAKAEFETVLKQNPPAAAKKTINDYLAAIATRESAKQTKATAYVEASVGHDSNVNFATSQSQIVVPWIDAFKISLGLPPGPVPVDNTKASDSYLGYAFGSEVSHQVNPALGLYAGVDLRSRSNNTQDRFDSTSVDARAGLALGQGANVVRLGVFAGKYELDGKSHRDSDGFNAEWRHVLNPANLLSVFGQHARYRFEPTISVNDFDQSTYGVNWMQIFNQGKGLVALTALTGDERAPLRAGGGKRFNGLRLGGQLQLNEKTDLFAGLGAQFSKYERRDVFFSTPSESLFRDDKQYDANLGVNWHYDKLWTVRPQIAYIRNNSNIVLYQADRTDVSITIRRDFK